MTREESRLSERSHSRLLVSGLVVLSLFAALFVRLFFLQVVDGSDLAAAAEANQVRTVFEEAPRGRILDRNNQVLASTRQVQVVTVDRTAPQKDPTLVPRLSSVLGMSPDDLRTRLNDQRTSRYRPAVVAENLDKARTAVLEERSTEFPGVRSEDRVERWYPNGSLAAHALGYVGEINEDELRRRSSDGYNLGDQIGKAGVEAALEPALRGKPGTSRIEVDSSGRAVRVLDRTAAVPGNDVHLAMDINVQRAAEEGLAQGISAIRASPPALAKDLASSGGSVMAVDPRDGGVLAMASFPTYEPTSFAKGISTSDYAKLSDPNQGRAMSNRAVQGTYAPGSTFKLVTATSAVENGIISPTAIVEDGGAYYLGGRRFQNAQGKAYGPVDMREAMTVSSDVYFYRLGEQFWNQRQQRGDALQQTARVMGFGRQHGIPLAGESAGRIPDPETRRKLHEQRPDAYPEGNWFAGDNVNLAIGQGDVLVTPLQLADVYASFSNGGTVPVPYMVNRVVEPGGRVMQTHQPKASGSYPLPPDVKNPIEDGLRGVVSDPRGTAYNAFEGFDLGRFPIAGKTGTAQVNGQGDTALFAGYGPVGSPSIAVSVVIEQGGFGSQSAAPVAEKVFGAAAGQATAPVQLEAGID